ncbi:hypothetical protein QNH46_05705 [Paenibacillus woosongensis]|uniref:Uncharacterized protein n=1 Tax=Paenibacillus woosongensis TaxID=307580 RepID=A0AA95I434_9BACL|nr:hypothetical protein [Paenibacillus woosongensis]WHX50159.1 hypothetical protein QNH46_05705 [Paenibacillus woosongensis]GIP59760.1 hypothetical protein J15TS10_35740 [Paenibacillus woosongensis]
MYLFLGRLLGRKLLRTTFLPAKRGLAGEMILRRPGFWSLMCIIGCLAGGVLLYFLFTENIFDQPGEEVIYRNAVMGIILLFLFMWLECLSYKASATDSFVAVRHWYGTKTIHYHNITSVEHTRFFGGQFVVLSNQGVVRVPDGAVGSAEFIQHLCKELGEEHCVNALKVLEEKKTQLQQLS